MNSYPSESTLPTVIEPDVNSEPALYRFNLAKQDCDSDSGTNNVVFARNTATV